MRPISSSSTAPGRWSCTAGAPRCSTTLTWRWTSITTCEEGTLVARRRAAVRRRGHPGLHQHRPSIDFDDKGHARRFRGKAEYDIGRPGTRRQIDIGSKHEAPGAAGHVDRAVYLCRRLVGRAAADKEKLRPPG